MYQTSYLSKQILNLALLQEQQHLISIYEKLQVCQLDYRELEQKRNKLFLRAEEIKNIAGKGIINRESTNAVMLAFRAARGLAMINCHFAEHLSSINRQFEECSRRYQVVVEELNNAMQKRPLLVAKMQLAKEIALHQREFITNSIYG